MYRFLACLLLASLSTSLMAADNRLTLREKKQGWILLFDGETTDGWQTIRQQPLPQRHVEQGALNPHPCDYMLMHSRVWDDFVLTVDVKISKGCNSGIFFRTFPLTPREGKDIGYNGLEIAIDDTATAGYHDTGAIYDLVKPRSNTMKPLGQWNSIRLTCKGNQLSVEVNGTLVSSLNLDLWTEKNRRPDGSEHKFDIAYKHHPRKGYIGLQDHGADCWFKNIKILPLKD